MFRGLIVGILLGVVLVIVGVYLYFSTGSAPVAVTAPPMPFERTFAHMGLNAYLKKLPHPEPQVPENEASYMAGRGSLQTELRGMPRLARSTQNQHCGRHGACPAAAF